MNENINQLNENFETYQEILKNDMDYQNNNITSSNEQIKCYCGHTDYCDCGPLEEPKQETLEEAAFRLYPRLINDPYNPSEDDNKEERNIWIKGTKWQQERMFEIMDSYVDDVMGGCTLRAKEWFEQFKNK